MPVSAAELRSRWRDASVWGRYEMLYGEEARPPQPSPKPEPSSLLSVGLSASRYSAEEHEERDRVVRKAKMLVEIETGLAAEEKQAAQARRDESERVMNDTALGKFFAGGLR